jgi:hypothetical protein
MVYKTTFLALTCHEIDESFLEHFMTWRSLFCDNYFVQNPRSTAAPLLVWCGVPGFILILPPLSLSWAQISLLLGRYVSWIAAEQTMSLVYTMISPWPYFSSPSRSESSTVVRDQTENSFFGDMLGVPGLVEMPSPGGQDREPSLGSVKV